MKFKIHGYDGLVVALILMPSLYLAYLYPTLPAAVPTHFDIHGKANAISDKSKLWQILLIMGLISLVVYLVIRFLPQIDPKKWAKYSTASTNKIAVAVVLLQTTIACLIVYAANSGSFQISRALPVAIGLFFAVLGNFMHNIKPNYFVGIRTPWTLESEETWRKTHQLSGKLWFVGGLIISVLCLILPVEFATYVLLAGTLILAMVPTVYSYQCFQSLQRNKKMSDHK